MTTQITTGTYRTNGYPIMRTDHRRLLSALCRRIQGPGLDHNLEPHANPQGMVGQAKARMILKTVQQGRSHAVRWSAFERHGTNSKKRPFTMIAASQVFSLLNRSAHSSFPVEYRYHQRRSRQDID
ncbi:dna tbp-interacting protein [Moniliophthora roreri]|nr:dna tbp-interacting protein [Moniliophthora roreri]